TVIVDPARATIRDELGIPPENVCIAATHTHSGPLTVRTREGIDYSMVTAAKIAGSVRVALASMQEVSLKAAHTGLSAISQNRRHPDGPIETVLKVLLAAPAGGADPVATVINYACHATVLEHDNLLYSADFPGAATALVEHALGGAAIYMQGACGNINPAWMRHDFAEVRRIGGIVGSAAARLGHELRAVGEGQSCINLSWSEELPVEPAPGTLLDNVSLASARTFLELPYRSMPDLAEIDAEIASLTAQLDALSQADIIARRTIRPRLNQLRMDRITKERHPSSEGPTRRLEVQAFRLSPDAAIVMLPGECFVQTGKEIEQRAGIKHLFICAYANDYAGYFAPTSEWEKAGYEVGSTRFEPDAADAVADAAVSLVQSLCGGHS
ncbi:MAG TPA: hypothetical protein VJQ83_03520, partial [Tepidiformaceae bacterium]|nr:hypothetical protein [Tepidiformaceae bacterium]